MESPSARTAVVVIVVGFLAFSVFSWFPEPEVKDYTRTLIAGVVLWFFYKGKNWARWVVAALSAFGSVFGIYAIVALRLEPVQAAPLLLMTAFYAVVTFLLLSGKVVGPHFDSTVT